MTASLPAAYRTEGYLLHRNLLSADDLRPIQEALVETVRSVEKLSFTGYQDRELVEYFKAHPDRVTEIYNAFQGHPALMELSRNPKVLDVVRGVIPNPKCYRKMPFRIDVPFETKELAFWHQDNFYVQGTVETVTVWVPFQDVPWQSGSLGIMPRSHLLGSVPHDLRVGKRSIPAGIYDREVRYVEMQAGDVLLFHSLLFHTSNLNLSDTVRYSIQIRYLDSDAPEGPAMKGTFLP
jgi:ectoine hydroxylase-related dioxygenase (phytanoyl-CoA dioxygenase family)